MRRLTLLVTCALALAGCGIGEGEEREGGAELRITRDFGHTRLAAGRVERVREDQTVMRLLRSAHDVDVRFGGGFVNAIDGLESKGGSRRRDWFFWVNGIESGVGAGTFELSPGDVVQWDYRRWDAAMRVPATVGAYPEPFLHGFEGKRLPVRVECADPEGDACEQTQDALAGAGVRVSGAKFGSSAGGEVIRVIVAPWHEARRLASIRTVEEGPDRSGVFVRFADGGRRLELLDDGGDTAAEEGPGAGLVAATAFADAKAVWVVTGVDDAGVLAAARALDERTLRDAFAVAVTPRGVRKLPLVDGR